MKMCGKKSVLVCIFFSLMTSFLSASDVESFRLFAGTSPTSPINIRPAVVRRAESLTTAFFMGNDSDLAVNKLNPEQMVSRSQREKVSFFVCVNESDQKMQKDDRDAAREASLEASDDEGGKDYEDGKDATFSEDVFAFEHESEERLKI